MKMRSALEIVTRPEWGFVVLAAVMLTAGSATAERYNREDRHNAEQYRFWESDALPGQPAYTVILDRATGCRYIGYRGKPTAPMMKNDGTGKGHPDCTGMQSDSVPPAAR